MKCPDQVSEYPLSRMTSPGVDPLKTPVNLSLDPGQRVATPLTRELPYRRILAFLVQRLYPDVPEFDNGGDF